MTRFDRPSFPVIVLSLIAVFLLFVIVSGTVWAFGRRSHQGAVTRTLMADGKKNPVPQDVVASDPSGKTAIFSDIGRLRAPTADKRTVTVVIEPYLSYPSGDVPFQEELVQKKRAMRARILDWFRSRKIDDIDRLGEAAVKSSLIEEINGLLALGKIDAMYFSEYMVIE